MSDGSEKSIQGRPSVDDFGRAISRVSVAQICETVGFEGFKESALDALSDVVIRYLRDLGKAATFYANLSGRTECNVFDVVRGLEDLGISVGFSGAFNSMGCVANSGIVKELIDFVGSNEDVPFAQPIPRFPVYRDRRLIPSFMSMNEDPPGKHIPAWLPALPDPHTYLHTSVWNERVTDPRAEKIEQARQRRKAERALLSLQQRLLSNGSVAESSSTSKDVSELAVVANGSQLISPGPSKPVTNNGSMVGLPDKMQNTVSVMDAFAPAIEAAATQDMVCDVNDDSERKFIPEKRPAVNFKLKSSKKLLGQSSCLSNSKRREGRAGYYLGREDERDDKKRRAEYILRQSIENPQELTLL